MNDTLDGISTFVAVADAKGFRAAADRLGVTGSAVSQAIRRLEARVGVTLVERTTRSMRLTIAGERLLASVRPALQEINAAVTSVTELSSEPRGVLRVLIAPVAESFLSDALLAGFLKAHPHVSLDLVLSEEPHDIVEAGFDAGVRLGEVIDGDMLAVPVSGDLRLLVVGSPDYFKDHPAPTHPRDLAAHACINWHPLANSPSYRWEFTDPDSGRDFSVAVPERVLTTDPALNVRLARAGIGLTLADQHRIKDDLDRGELISVLDEFTTPFPGFYLYYPRRRHTPPALRAFVEYLKSARRRSRARTTPRTV